MYCDYPITLYRSKSTNRPTSCKTDSHGYKLKMTAPCNKCWKCRAREAREWAVRIHHESLTHEVNSFITLTYAPEHLPKGGTLRKEDVQQFMKNLRQLKEFKNTKIRYFAAGEYGGKYNRPHYHVVLFGLDFPDKKYWRKSKKGYRIYRSKLLERAWSKGHSEIGTVTINSSKYTANYVTKKVNGQNKEQHYDGRIPEYSTMSRNPPIGYEYYKKHRDEIIKTGNVQYLDKEIKAPRTYERTFAKISDQEKLDKADQVNKIENSEYL